MVQHKIIGKANGIGSNKVINLQGYVKPSTTSPITAADNLNTALGKLEKGMELRFPTTGGTFTGDVSIAAGKKFIGANNYGFMNKKTDGTAIYSLLIGTDNRLHLGWAATIPITIDANDVSFRMGATFGGQIQKAGVSSSWVTGRTNAMIRMNTSNGYSPILSAKSPAGSWELGTYVSDICHLSYITDANFNANNNATTAQFQFKPSGDFFLTGSITAAGNVTAFSDIKLKENITPIENALDKVKQLKGIIYNLKGDENNKQAGLIAQDVQKVLPEVVLENDNGLLSIDYSRIVSLLVNAIIELDKKVGGK